MERVALHMLLVRLMIHTFRIHTCPCAERVRWFEQLFLVCTICYHHSFAPDFVDQPGHDTSQQSSNFS